MLYKLLLFFNHGTGIENKQKAREEIKKIVESIKNPKHKLIVALAYGAD